MSGRSKAGRGVEKDIEGHGGRDRGGLESFYPALNRVPLWQIL
jgi:hypothetical protein